MKYLAPLPWLHLANDLRPSLESVRIVLDKVPTRDTKCLAEIYVGSSDLPQNDPFRLLEAKGNVLSERQKACLNVFTTADPFSHKRDRYLLTMRHIETLCLFINDVVLEIKGQGAITKISQPARIRARLEANMLHFEPADHDGLAIESPQVLGVEQTFLLDPHLRLYHVEPALLPKEAHALLMAEPLPLSGLFSEEAESTFAAVVQMGVDLDALLPLAVPSSPEPEIELRVILSSTQDVERVTLRAHLVSRLYQDGLCEEIEVTARGVLSPVHALSEKSDRALSHEDVRTFLVKRPHAREMAAKRALYALGLTASSKHRGFWAQGQNALDVVTKIAKREGLPEWLIIDQDAVPTTISIPNRPLLRVSETEDDQGLYLELDLGADDLDVPLDSLAEVADRLGTSLFLDDEHVLHFSPEAARAIRLIQEVLDLKRSSQKKRADFYEAALLLRALEPIVQVAATDALKSRLTHFIPEVLPVDQTLPQGLQSTLRPYQHDALTWMSQLHRAGLGRLLADDMGLGKTLMVLSLLMKLKEQEGPMPSLVIAPTSVIDVWVFEANRHLADFKVIKWHGVDRVAQKEDLASADLVVTSYALLRRDAESILADTQFRYLILDEAQNVKNPRTESYKSAQKIKAQQRLALTGTPIENRVLDLFSIVSLVAPGVLGTEASFTRRYQTPIAQGNADRALELRERLRPMILRRKKADVESDLPPKIENILHCDMDADQRALYISVLTATKNELQEALIHPTQQKSHLPILAAITRLRQVCCDPSLYVDTASHPISSAKINLFLEVLNECLGMGRRIIIYSQFIKMQEILLDLLKQNGVPDALWLHGASKNRGDIVAKFQDPNGPKAIVVSLKAGGTGITLTAADTVIYYDPWWNPAVLDQAADRAHRIGQTKAVHLIKLICNNTIEEQILALSEKKRAMAEDMLVSEKSGQRALTLEEIHRLLSVELDRVTSL